MQWRQEAPPLLPIHSPNLTANSDHPMHAIDATVLDQLRTSTDIHNVHVLPVTCCHQSSIHVYG
jgi:hypothetical protein